MIWKDKWDILQVQDNLCDEHAKAYKPAITEDNWHMDCISRTEMTNNYFIQLVTEHASAQKKYTF